MKPMVQFDRPLIEIQVRRLEELGYTKSQIDAILADRFGVTNYYEEND